MERIKPIDLEKAVLGVRLRGYDRRQVDDLLRRAAKEIETLISELKQTREIAESTLREVEGYRAQETTLREALVLAQRTAEDTRATAREEADLILEKARHQGEEAARQAQARINDLRWEIERLSLEKTRFAERFRSLLEEHLRAIDPSMGAQPALVNLEVAEDAEQVG